MNTICWIYIYFIFIITVKANASHGAQLNRTPSRDATPTADVETLNLEGAGNRRRAFSTDVCYLMFGTFVSSNMSLLDFETGQI